MARTPSDRTQRARPTQQAIDIVRDPTDIPAPIGKRAPAVVRVELTAKEVVGQLDLTTHTLYRYWTFNGKVPGPMIRVRQGDTVQVTLHNDPASHMVHSVDFHAALGPRGGAALSQAPPGQTKIFSFQATTPGLYVYHCGTPVVAEHIANGMYGLILVEPPGGLPHVDREYYIVQGEIYTAAAKGKSGLQQFSDPKLMQETPEYYVFNGAVDALTKEHPLKANIGETVRIFFADAGPNKPASMHILGEIFDRDYRAGSLESQPLASVQTALVAPGSAAILMFKAADSGEFTIVDHAMARVMKGAVATLVVSGRPNTALMHAGPSRSNSAISGMTQIDVAANSSNAGEGEVTAMPPRSASAAAGAISTVPAHGTSKGKAALSPARAPVPTALDGCLRIESNGAILHLLRSPKEYHLEARPLLFAENDNRLVHVTGRVGSVVANENPDIPGFVVDEVDELAPNCSAKISPAEIRRLLAQSGSTGTTAAEVGATVGMTELRFTPAAVTIKVGQKVVWKNSSGVIHNVVDDASRAMNPVDVQLPSGAKPFGSDFLQPGQSFSEVFTKPGTYRYVCTLHEGSGMKGEVIVR